MKQVYPELIYRCPVTERQIIGKAHCENIVAKFDLPLHRCPHYRGVKTDGWGPSVTFDVILCNYQSSKILKGVEAGRVEI